MATRLSGIAAIELKHGGRLAYREVCPDGEPAAEPVLFVHGFPETSYMWRAALQTVASCGRRGIAPDLIGYGDSPPDPPATWERHLEALDEFISELGLERLALVVHDWGGLIGLRWACEHPERIAGLLISDSGFFPDGEWHGLADVLRKHGEGEQLLENLDRDTFAGLIRATGNFGDDTIDEYFKTLATAEGRAGVLEMYRSGDFGKLKPYEGKLAHIKGPTLVLWGDEDAFAPVAGAYRFKRELPGAEVEVIDGAGHFIWGDEPETCAAALERWLGRSGSARH